MGFDFTTEFVRFPGALSGAIRILQRTQIDQVKITPLPDGVQIDFRARMASRVDIVVYKVISGNYAQDAYTDGAFAAMRIAFPKNGNRFSERMEADRFFRFEPGTEYWIDLACPDVDRLGKVYGTLRHRRRFKTSIRRFNSLPYQINVDGDSDSLGNGELTFSYRRFNLVLGTVETNRSSGEHSIASGGFLFMPFNNGFYEYDWVGAPRSVGFFFHGADDDAEIFPVPGKGFDLLPWANPETMPDWYQKSGSSSDYDWAVVTHRVELRSEPGEDKWTVELPTHPNGRLRFTVILRLHCVVEALPQPLYVRDWLFEHLVAGAFTRELDLGRFGQETAGRARRSVSFGGPNESVVQIALGVEGTCLVTLSDIDGQIAGRVDPSVRLDRLLALPGSDTGKPPLWFAVGAKGELLEGHLDVESLSVSWEDRGLALGNTPPVLLQSETHRAWLLTLGDGGHVLLDAAGALHRIAAYGKQALIDFRGHFWDGAWLVWGTDKAGASWYSLGDRTQDLFKDSLPDRLGAPIHLLADDKGAPVIYGVDGERILHAWRPGGDVEALGSFDAIVHTALEDARVDSEPERLAL